MSNLQIERVNELPSTLAPSSIYIVKGSDPALAEIYFTGNNAAEVKRIINKSDIVSLIGNIADLENSTYIATAATVIEALLLLDDKVANNNNAKMVKYVFANPSLQWNINHNLGTDDINVTIRDENNAVIMAYQDFIDENNLSIMFTEAQAGRVLLTYM